MVSSLYGIYNAQRGLVINQLAIDIINNNIANMNTEGYSKQRIEIEQLSSGNVSNIPEEMVQSSMGAVISAVTRNRDEYLDNYFRKENTDLNYFKELSESAAMIEDIVNELDNTGLSAAFNDFYDSLNQLSTNPNDFVIRNNVVQKAIDVANMFQSTYSQLEDYRTNLVGDFSNPATLEESKVKISIDQINNQLNSIATLNQDILKNTVDGLTPNHLLDARDKLLDDISEYMPFDITKETNGSITVRLGGYDLVSGNNQVGFLDVTSGDINNPATVQIDNSVGAVVLADANSLITSGKVGAILEMGGSDPNKLTIKGIMDDLDTLAQEFASEVNAVQTSGSYIDTGTGQLADADPLTDFLFVDDGDVDATNLNASNIQVRTAVESDPYLISAASIISTDPGYTGSETGDGNNALSMAQIRDKLIAGLGSSTTEGFVTKIVGDIGNKTQSINNSFDLKSSITEQVGLKRESVTGVNLDEELSDLVRYQRAYEASARIFSVMDQNLKTIIAMAR